MRRLASILAVVVVVAVTIAGCGGGKGPSTVGVVLEVDGDLTTVESFTLLTEDGTQVRFFPAPEVTFDGGPLSHLTSHVVSGDPVRVFYEKAPDGRFVATAVEDAS